MRHRGGVHWGDPKELPTGNIRGQRASDPGARHGPYLEWIYLKAGKLRHRTLTPEQTLLLFVIVGLLGKMTCGNETLPRFTMTAPFGARPPGLFDDDSRSFLKWSMRVATTRETGLRRAVRCNCGNAPPY